MELELQNETILKEQQAEEPEQPVRSKRKRRKGVIALCIILPIAWILSIVSAVLFTIAILQSSGNGSDRLSRALNDAVQIIRENYYFYDSDEAALTDAALKGVAEGTGDVYAYYYSAEEYAELTKQNEGSFVGIGILTMMNDDGTVRIVDVYDGTPASEAGLESEDLLIRINGVSYEGLDLNSFLNNIVAEDSAANELVVLRNGTEMAFTVVAREVHTPSVFPRMLTDTIGYIRISTFHGSCVQETEDAIKSLRAQGMTRLVLDLRDNLGGSLYDALDIADMFLPKNYVITSLRSRTDEEERFYTKKDGVDLPIVLLVNGYSASASELVAGALKDHEAAYLIGTTTYGKGIVQSFFTVPETGGMLKITTEAYYTPNGVCVHGTGIEPDEIVELSEEAERYSISILPFELDTQLKAAIAHFEQP